MKQKSKRVKPQKSLSLEQSKVMKIFKIRMVTIPNFEKGGFTPNFKVVCKGHVFYDYKKTEKLSDDFLRSISYYDFFIYESDHHKHNKKELLVYDDVKIQFYHKEQKKFHFWFNTNFIDESGSLFLNKEMIDKAASDKNCKYFDKNFSIKVFMTHIDNYNWVMQTYERD